MTLSQLPHWDLTNVFPSLESEEFRAAFASLKDYLSISHQRVSALEALDAGTSPVVLAERLNLVLESWNHLQVIGGTISSFIHSFVSTDSYNQEAKRLESEFDQMGVDFSKLETRMNRWVGSIAAVLPQVTAQPGSVNEHAFYLGEVAEQSRYLMSQPEEELAAELSLSGAVAWTKLQGTVTSQLTWEIEVDGETRRLPMTAIINLRSHPDEATRRRGYEVELKAWEQVKEPLAASLNGVKGAVNTLNRRRGRQDALHSALDVNRIDRATLDAMLTAMRESLPMFERYFKAKAARLGKEKLAWWDLFAPTGKADRTYSFDEAREMILQNFAEFSPELAAFAQNAFEKNWIDAEMRSGKRGGAFCMGVPGVKESRVLCNFDGSLDSVSTMAHELGHAFHNYCAYQAGRTELQQVTPMTMAETASIMCETILVEAALEQSTSPEETLYILETALIGDSQVVVDIYSRFLFEKEIFERREKSELSAEDFSAIMTTMQKAAYGNGLDERYLQPYMWTWKPHYYYAGLSFYNFPYTFGLLFGTGLYAIYKQRGADFVNDYKDLLASTGMDQAADLAARFGIDIRSVDFWRGSLAIIGKRVERYLAL